MRIKILPLLALALAVLTLPAFAAGELQQMIQAAQQSVVNVQTNRSFRFRWSTPGFLEQFVIDFMEADRRTETDIQVRGEGTGIIVDAAGLVLTNAHVIDGASTIFIKFDNQTILNAEVVSKNIKEDLALLHIKSDQSFQPLPFGDSSKVAQADEVYAVGNPYGFQMSVTKGIVSATKREIKQGNQVILQEAIQTDAALNPGNSGGPLLNTEGELIGIVTGGHRYAEGMGFAIPSNRIQSLLEELKTNRKVYETQAQFFERFGFRVEETKTAEGDWLVISEIRPGSAVDKAGLRTGDVLLQFEKKSPARFETLWEIAGPIKPGTRLYLQIQRNNRRFFTYVEVQP